MNDVLLKIENISKTYKKSEVPALSNINLNITNGDIFGILGPNGAGKTTLISLICGLIKPDFGNITLNGLNLSKNLFEIKSLIGFVPQEIALYSQLTAVENLRFIGRMYDLGGEELSSTIHQYLKEFGLLDSANKRISAYSGGMKRRVNIIAGLLHKPKLLILDEPTVGVDVQSRNLILEKLIELNQSGVTMLYTSHYLEEAEDFCRNYAILDFGSIIKTGSLDRSQNKVSERKLEDIFIELTGRELRD